MHTWIDRVMATLGKKLNPTNPINLLPVEILSMIFSEAVARDDFEGQLTLASVCQHWREATFGIKGLWTLIDIQPRSLFSVDDMYDQLSSRLARAAPSPVDLTLRWDDLGWIAASDDDALQENMHRIRTLVLEVPPRALLHHFRPALSMPAPRLESLSLSSTAMQHDSHFPIDLFSDNAPVLRELFVDRLHPPSPSWSPLRTLRRFTYRALQIDWGRLANMIMACQDLCYLIIDAEHLELDDDHPAVAPDRRAAVAEQRRNLAMQLVVYDGDVLDVQNFLSSICCEDAKHVYLELSENAISWLIAEAERSGACGLHLTTNCGIQRMPGPMTATATLLSDARTRSAKLGLTGIGTFSAVFPALTTLTIEERFWPHPSFPAMACLHALTIVLEHPELTKRARHGPIGIFFLGLAAGEAWYLPALRTLHIAYTEPGEEWPLDPRGELWNKPPCGAPLVISAYELAAFLKWNLRSDHPLTLVLQSTQLFEPLGSIEWSRLSAMVASMAFEAEYDPRPVDYAAL